MKTPPRCPPHSTVLTHLAKHPWDLRAPSLALRATSILALIQHEDVRHTKLADQLKLDPSLLEKARKEPRRALVLTSFVSLAQMLGMMVVSEGIETAAQL